MSKEWVISAYNGFEVLQLRDCNQQDPQASEIRLRIEAFALNWGNKELMHDRYSFSFSVLPARVGIEATALLKPLAHMYKTLPLVIATARCPTFTTGKVPVPTPVHRPGVRHQGPLY